MAADGSDGNRLQFEKVSQRFQVVSARLQKNRYLQPKFDFYPQIKVISSVKCLKIMFSRVKLPTVPLISEQLRPKICEIPVT